MMTRHKGIYDSLRLRERHAMKYANKFRHDPGAGGQDCAGISSVGINIAANMPDSTIVSYLVQIRQQSWNLNSEGAIAN